MQKQTNKPFPVSWVWVTKLSPISSIINKFSLSIELTFLRPHRRLHGLEGFADSGSDGLLLLENGIELVVLRLSFGLWTDVVFSWTAHGCGDGSRWPESGDRSEATRIGDGWWESEVKRLSHQSNNQLLRLPPHSARVHTHRCVAEYKRQENFCVLLL